MQPRIINVGAYPPPYGGVSIHLKRLTEHLSSLGFDCLLIDLLGPPRDVPRVRALTWTETQRMLAEEPPGIVHFHNFSVRDTWAFFRASRRHAVILSFHNERFLDEVRSCGWHWRLIASFCLRRLRCLVVDSDHCRRLARTLVGPRPRVELIPEFLPPAEVPPLADPSLLELRRRHRWLIASNAWRLVFHQGQDLYGLDLLIDLVDHLVHRRALDVALAFLLSDVGLHDYLEQQQRRARELGIAGRISIVTEPIEEASSLWREADVVVRATNTDGNSLTVLEALAVGTPVVASDCSARPVAAVLFRSRDLTDLVARVSETLLQPAEHRRRLASSPQLSAADDFVRLYQSLGARSVVDQAGAR